MSGRFEISDTPLRGLRVIQRRPIGDTRGFLERLFCADELSELIPKQTIVQINHTLTVKRGTVRGMHFQHPPHAEMKFVSCLRGEVFDVAVDLRRGSSTFLRWHAERLGAANRKTLLIAQGFAHGFQALTDDCELLYFHTAPYRPAAEGGVNARDPMLAIRWPEEITELSPRDSSQPMLTRDYPGVAV
ncbi:MAG: dTDP-4-dehydrorhamnose 3,5-epimerase [Gemmatimonadetes bacterium]|nr:MAG: dTDP-4-dehydrorhamnose 3,5-epimerase [Gemmatimonadota bacterium]